MADKTNWARVGWLLLKFKEEQTSIKIYKNLQKLESSSDEKEILSLMEENKQIGRDSLETRAKIASEILEKMGIKIKAGLEE